MKQYCPKMFLACVFSVLLFYARAWWARKSLELHYKIIEFFIIKIISRARVGYEMIDNQLGVYNRDISNKREWNIFF